MKSLKIFAVIAVVLAFVSSCSKSPKDILTTTTWLQDSVLVGGADQIKDCDRDDYVTFNTSGKSITVPMGVACNSSETTDTVNYSLSEDAKTFTIDYKMGPNTSTLSCTVTELTSSKFIATGSFSGIPFTVKFRAK